MSKVVVVAIGGNSLIKSPDKISVADHYEACYETSEQLVKLVKKGYRLIITHGNGPQVGFVLRRSELAVHEVHGLPLDSCVANTQGGIGYLLQLAMKNVLIKNNIDKQILTIVTQVLVSEHDKSLRAPTKPIGFFMDKEHAMQHKNQDGWHIIEDAGRGYRRVVSSPYPLEILEIDAIKSLLKSNAIIITAGGGGIPVIRLKDGTIKGIEAVIDKDHASSLLAKELKADYFVISTSVPKVYLNYGTGEEKPLDKLTVKDAEKYIEAGHFKTGSMLPKIQACIAFTGQRKKVSIITEPDSIYEAISGSQGTHIIP